jgi:hypothetical protein
MSTRNTAPPPRVRRGRKEGQSTAYTHELHAHVVIRVHAGSVDTAITKAAGHVANLNEKFKYLTVELDESSVRETKKPDVT